MHLEEGLFFSEEAQSARVEMLYDERCVNIIIEDLNKEYLYENIFSRLMPVTMQTNFLGVGGKQAVYSFYREKKDEALLSNEQCFFYILDGDFDRYLTPESMLKDSCCVYLQTYNIENYFIDEEACINFIQGRLKLSRKKSKEKLNFLNWKERIIAESSKLFLLYCYIQKNFPSDINVARAHGEFIDYKTGFERVDGAFEKYEKKYRQLDSNLTDSCQCIDEDYKKIYGEDYFNLICGKFLFTSLVSYIKTKLKPPTNSTIYNDDFQWHLVSNFDVSSLNYLKDAILNFASSTPINEIAT